MKNALAILKFLIVIQALTATTMCKIIRLNLSKFYDGYYSNIEVTFDRFARHFYNRLSQKNLYSVFHEGRYNQILPEENQKTIEIDGNKVQVKYSVNPVFLIKCIIDFEFYHTIDEKDERFVNRCISFAFKHPSNKNSIVYRLFEEKIIDKLSFTFDLLHFTPSGDNSLYIGTTPDEAIKDLNKGTCQVGRLSRNWSCALKGVEVSGHKDSAFNFYGVDASFDIGEKSILVPSFFVDYLNKHFFSLESAKKLCSLGRPWNGKSYINCKSDVKEIFPSITFKIEDNVFELKAESLFSVQRDGVVFLMMVGDDWVLGAPFLEKYVTIFDYETQSIEFYSRLPLRSSEGAFSLKNYFVAIIGLLLIGITINIYFYLKK